MTKTHTGSSNNSLKKQRKPRQRPPPHQKTKQKTSIISISSILIYSLPGLVSANTCPQTNQYYDSGTSTCVQCHANCATCNGALSTNCLSCSSTKTLTSSNSCQCSTNSTALDSSQKCKACSSSCIRCQDYTFECMECSKGFYVSSAVKEYCHQLYSVKLRLKYFDKKKSVVFFKFDQILEEADFSTLMQLKLKNLETGLEVPCEKCKAYLKLPEKTSILVSIPRSLETTVTDQNGQTSTTTVLENGLLTLTFDKSIIKSAILKNKARRRNLQIQGQPRQLVEARAVTYTEDNLSYSPITIASSLIEEIIKSSKLAIQLCLGVLIITALFLVPHVGLMALKVPQIGGLMDFVNVDFPTNISLFFEIFDNGFFGQIGNVLLKVLNFITFDAFKWFTPEWVRLEEAKLGCFPHRKMLENDMGCMIIGNSGGILVIILLFIFLKTIIFCIHGFVVKKKMFNWIPSIRKIDEDYFGLTLFCYMALALQIDLLVPSFVNIREMSTKDALNFASTMICLLITIPYIVSLTYIASRIDATQTKAELKHFAAVGSSGPFLERKAYLQKWEFLIKGLKTVDTPKSLKKVGLGRHVRSLQILRDYLIPFFVVIILEDAIFQLLPAIILHALTTYLIIKYSPLKKKREQHWTSFLEICFTVIYCIFMIFRLCQSKMSESQKSVYIGLPTILILAVCTIGCIIFTALEIYDAIRLRFKGKNVVKEKVVLNESRQEEQQPEAERDPGSPQIQGLRSFLGRSKKKKVSNIQQVVGRLEMEMREMKAIRDKNIDKNFQKKKQIMSMNMDLNESGANLNKSQVGKNDKNLQKQLFFEDYLALEFIFSLRLRFVSLFDNQKSYFFLLFLLFS